MFAALLAPAILSALAPIVAEAAPKLLGAITGSERVETTTRAVVGAIGAGAGFPIRSLEDADRAVALYRAEPARFEAVASELRQLEDAYLRDMQDARRRDLEIRRMSGGENRRADYLLAGVFGMLVLCLGGSVALAVWVEAETPLLQAATGLLGTAVGFLLRGVSSALDFEFGSSRGSKDKGEQIAAALPAIAAADFRLAPTPIAGPLPAPAAPRGMAPVEEPGDRPGGWLR